MKEHNLQDNILHVKINGKCRIKCFRKTLRLLKKNIYYNKLHFLENHGNLNGKIFFQFCNYFHAQNNLFLIVYSCIIVNQANSNINNKSARSVVSSKAKPRTETFYSTFLLLFFPKESPHACRRYSAALCFFETQ